MELIINDLMTMLEISNIQYLYVAIGIVIGVLIIWRLWK